MVELAVAVGDLGFAQQQGAVFDAVRIVLQRSTCSPQPGAGNNRARGDGVVLPQPHRAHSRPPLIAGLLVEQVGVLPCRDAVVEAAEPPGCVSQQVGSFGVERGRRHRCGGCGIERALPVLPGERVARRRQGVCVDGHRPDGSHRPTSGPSGGQAETVVGPVDLFGAARFADMDRPGRPDVKLVAPRASFVPRRTIPALALIVYWRRPSSASRAPQISMTARARPWGDRPIRGRSATGNWGPNPMRAAGGRGDDRLMGEANRSVAELILAGRDREAALLGASHTAPADAVSAAPNGGPMDRLTQLDQLGPPQHRSPTALGTGGTMNTTFHTDALDAVKQGQQATWATGDYAVIGTTLQIVGEQLCEAVDVRAGWQVLDVAAGNGNAALAAARRGCEVVATDYVDTLLHAAARRADAEGLPLAIRVADAENLPFDDDTFDAVLSTFGVMFTPNPDAAASELRRVCRPGGQIGLANWTPDGFVGHMFKVIGAHVPTAGRHPFPALLGEAGAPP